MSSPRDDVRYRDLARLGSGGMATVTLAEDTMLGRRVALKRVHASGDPRGLTRLKREALVGASLSHPNLVSVYDVLTETDGDLMIVMEYVPGETLRDAIQKRGALAPKEAMRILAGVAAGLDAIHARGIVHRDVKPANILLGTDGAVKLADLGIAAVADRTQTTTAGGVVGSFSYMAPEQLEAQSSNRAMDVFALAAVAFEMLSGKKARPETNPLALAYAMSTSPPPDLRDQWAQAPASAAAALQRGMASDPGVRPSTAGELVQQLRGALDPPAARAAAAGSLLPRDTKARASARTLRSAPAAAKQPERARAKQRHPIAPVPAELGRARPSQERSKGDQGAKSGEPVKQAVGRGQGRSSRIAPVLVLVAVLLVAGVVLAALNSGGKSGGNAVQAAASAHRSTRGRANRASQPSTTGAASGSTAKAGSAAASNSGAKTASGSAGGTTSAAAGGTAASAAAAAGSGQPTLSPASGAAAPTKAVHSFYEDAARHDYLAAWNLADANMRNQLGGFASFQGQMSSVRSITFHRAQALAGANPSSATVSISTTSVQLDKTQQCSGTARTARTTSGQWLLDGISVNCSTA